MDKHARTAPSREPVFLVGVPRSGTTLLSAMLGAHPDLSCGPETHFFWGLDRGDASRLIAPGNWPAAAVNFLTGLQDEGQSVPAVYGIDQAGLGQFLQQRQAGVPAILEALTEQFMVRLGKRRWVEKSPTHMNHLESLRRYYPGAPVIHIVRDPRDVARSILKAPWDWAPKTLNGALILWRDYEAAASRFLASDHRNLLVRYEDLLTDPQKTLKTICEFIGEDYTDAMLDTRSSYDQVNRLDEPWKHKVSGAIDKSRVAAWKGKLSEEEIRQSEILLGDRLQHYGYPCTTGCRQHAAVSPFRVVKKFPEMISWLDQQQTCMWQSTTEDSARISIFVGDPLKDGWFPAARWPRLQAAASFAIRLLSRRFSGHTLYWVCDHGEGTSAGLAHGLVRFLLKRLATPVQVPRVTTRYGIRYEQTPAL